MRNNSSVAKTVALKAEFRREGESDPVWDDFMEFPGSTPYVDWDLVVPANTQMDVTGELQRVDIQKRWNPFITQRFLPAGTYQVTIRAYEYTEAPNPPFNPVLQDSLEIPQLIPVSAQSKPDLKFPTSSYSGLPRTRMELSPSAVQPGGSLTITDISVANGGVEDSPPSVVRFYANDTPIGSNVPVPALGRSQYYDINEGFDTDSDPVELPDTTVTIPASVGTGLVDIYAVVDPEDDVDEDAELNNRILVGTIVVGFQPDLADAGAPYHVIPEAVLPGGTSQLKVRVRNQGLGQSGSFATSFYLFDSRGVTDQDITGAISLGSVTTSGLAFLQTLDLPLTFTIPSGTTSGTWYVGWRFDSGNAATETVETNNFHVSNQPLHVGPAVNLRPGSTPFALSATEVVAGGSFTLTGSRANTGSAAAGTHRSWVVLSTDNVVNSGDLVLVNTLQPETATPAGSDFPLSHSITLSAGIAPGVYHVGYIFDATNQVNELREGDNIVTLSELLQIVAPTPPGSPPPAPVILNFEVGSRDAFISWTSRKGLSYEVETSENARNWDFSGAATGEAGVTGFILPDFVAGRPFQFVRIRLLP